MAERRLQSVAALTSIALVCGVLLAGTQALTAQKVSANHTQHAQRELRALLGGSLPAVPEFWVDDVWHLCNGSVVARAQAAGYAGPIELLFALSTPGSARIPGKLHGVRITRHQETPGIADFLNTPDIGWLAALVDTDPADVALFDAVTGATITSEAIQAALVEAISRTSHVTVGCET